MSNYFHKIGMKKNVILLLFVAISTFTFAKQTLISIEPVEIRETFISNENNKRKNFISYKELENDIDYLFYYLKTAYAGYDELLQNGFSEEKFREQFKEKYGTSDKIETRILMREFAEKLSDYVNDKHLYTLGNNEQEWYSANSFALFYYTNTFVKKENDNFLVSKTDSPSIKSGAKFTGNEKNLFYYPAKGKNTYRVGVISKQKISDYKFSFDETEINIPVYDDGNIQISFSPKYHEIETENSIYISLSSFKVQENDSKFKKGSEIILKKFADLGKTWRNKKNIIIDLRSNGGGMIEYCIYPFYAMTQKNPQSFKNFQKADIFSDDFFFEQVRITSPATLQAHIKYFEDLGEIKCQNYKKYKKNYEKSLKSSQKQIFKQQCDFSKEIKTYFNGKVIFLLDRNSYSASELSPLFAKRILGENVKIIGENSAGCIQFGDVLPYQLPNSRIAISLSSAKNTLLNYFENWHGEQYGIYPDYWALGCDLNETIFLETNDSEMKEKLKNIEFRLL